MILYLHGFNSSPLSEKARILSAYFAERGALCAVPQLHHRPSKAIAQAEVFLNDDGHHTVAGSSMGGYYATWLCEKYPNTRAVLINPAVKLAEKLADCVDKTQTNYHNNETYLFDKEHLQEFEALEITALQAPKKYLLLAQTGDEVLDYREAADFYQGAEQIIVEGGDHSFVNFADYLPRIAAFVTQ